MLNHLHEQSGKHDPDTRPLKDKGSDSNPERTLEINTEAQSMLHEVLRVAHLAHVAQQIDEIKNQ